MNCKSCTSLLVPYLKKGLHPDQNLSMEDHLAQCEDCRREMESARALLKRTEDAVSADIIATVHKILEAAIHSNASDIHLEPQQDNSMLVRLRIDGVLQQHSTIGNMLRDSVTQRIKMMSEMDLSESHKVQDGRFTVKLAEGERLYDFRVNVMPFVYGEGFVMRILDKGWQVPELEQLGFEQSVLDTLFVAAKRPSGLVLISGPVGSGKTTVAYSLLQSLVHPGMKAVSVEDPVECTIQGVNQIHFDRSKHSFSGIVRGFLRHDPDLIFVGEVKDPETAAVACEAAVSGHMVIASSFGDSAISTLRQLIEWGVSPAIVVESIQCILNQRLLRKVCPHCKSTVSFDDNPAAYQALDIDREEAASAAIVNGKGCDRCLGTGYRGRFPLSEVLSMSQPLKQAILAKQSWETIEYVAAQNGFQNLKQAAKTAVLTGITPVEEPLRFFVG